MGGGSCLGEVWTVMNIRKVAISEGVFWVEIPAANLRILCASPEDSVKHLIRRGFIYEVEDNQVTFETGPNAILLSDVSTQNGSFSNLAEFPILQMLYRQGMILPGHPNNFGIKPLLIGSEGQVRAQLTYIFRGNYGLISEQELIDAGVAPDMAHDMMRMKLKFAFGAIKSPRDILDICVVEDGIATVRNNAFISRVAPNVFEIAYGGDAVEVDLNLPANASYEPPYHLGYHTLKREYFAIVHSGDGDGWDCNRPTMSSIIMFQGRIYLIDAGPNISNTLRSLGISISEIEGLFLTHAHDDHFAGVTTLMRADRPLKFFATSFVRVSALKKLSSLLSINEDEFAHFFEFRDLALGAWNNVDGLEVKPVFSPHPVENTCMLFRAIDVDGYKTYAHLADIVSFKVLGGMVTDDASVPGVSQALFDQVSETYLEPANVKKIDVGGGMIHGEAADFATDTSDQIVLAHRATPLTAAERRIGAGAPFGTVDVLIQGAQDYTYQRAARLLRSYFPGIEAHTLQAFLNGPIVHYNPESFIAKSGAACDSPILLLSGQVERLVSGGAGQAQMASGAIIGEFSALDKLPLKDTYRAISFVATLHIPAAPYRQFAEANDIVSDIHNFAAIRSFLQRTRIFNDNMSRRLLHELVEHAREIVLEDGAQMTWDPDEGLFLVMDGAIQLMLDGDVRETIPVHGVFGETFVLFGVSPVYDVVAHGRTTLLLLDGDRVAGIPVARWKLLELYQQRIHNVIINTNRHENAFQWVDAFYIGIDAMDRQHQNLFRLASIVLTEVMNGATNEATAKALHDLVAATEEHFETEETLIEKVRYAKTGAHKSAHHKLLNEIRSLESRVREGDPLSAQEFRSFFLSWIVFHILGEDRKYAKHIHAARKSA